LNVGIEAKSTHRLERDLSRKFWRETELEKSPTLTNCCSGSKKHCREFSLPSHPGASRAPLVRGVGWGARGLVAAVLFAHSLFFVLPLSQRVMYVVVSCLLNGNADLPLGRLWAAAMPSAGAALEKSDTLFCRFHSDKSNVPSVHASACTKRPCMIDHDGRSAGEQPLIQGGETMPIFGDIDGPLTDHEQGGNQNLFGTPADTTVIGDARDITDFARGGDDSLTGVSDVLMNNLFGDALQVMSAKAQGGDDILLVGGETSFNTSNFLYGDAHDMVGFAKGGNDILIGENTIMAGSVVNVLRGDAFALSNKAQGGDDNLIGGNKFGSGTVLNVLIGDASEMADSAKGGNDTLTGGNTVLVPAGLVHNQLIGDAVHMLGTSKGGNDVLIAGRESVGSTVKNEMWGDAQTMSETAQGGADLFVFQDNTSLVDALTVGTDNTIYDFSLSQHDAIQFIGVAGVSGFGDLDIETTSKPGSTVIHAGADEVTLLNFTGTLTANEFLFG
jgi:hypothetical protein